MNKGQITDVHIKTGPEATVRDIQLHGTTVKRMQQYSGLSHHAQLLKDRWTAWRNQHGVPTVGTKGWEAQLELKKLPQIIEDRANRLAKGGLDEKSQLRLEAELADLKHQMATHEKTFKSMDKDPGKGFVAAESINKGIKVAKGETIEIGSKLEYFLGRATGSKHNIDRSQEMLRRLENIGLPDNPANRQSLLQHFSETYNNSASVVRIQENGRVVRESLLMGPNGAVKIETIWEGNKLITGAVYPEAGRFVHDSR
jgi:hypothetical protein